MSIVYDAASARQRLTRGAAQRNLAAECRAVEEGHNCRIDHTRGVFVVRSDTSPVQYVLTCHAVNGLLSFSCTPEALEPGFVVSRSLHLHSRRSALGVLGCKHAARCAQRLERAGLAYFDGTYWRSTEKAEELGR
jgi:hypothetical protein